MEENTENQTSYYLVGKIPPMHLACSNDELRPAMGFIRFLNGYASCTNGHLIAIAETSAMFTAELAEELDGYFIHSSGYKYLYDVLKKRGVSLTLTEEGIVIQLDDDHTHTLHIFTEYDLKNKRLADASSNAFPNWETIWNEAAKKAKDQDLYEHWIQVNPSFIALIHSVFGSPASGMKIRPTGNGNPILVSSTNETWGDMFALIMPLMKSQQEFEFITVKNPTPKFTIESEQTQ